MRYSKHEPIVCLFCISPFLSVDYNICILKPFLGNSDGYCSKFIEFQPIPSYTVLKVPERERHCEHGKSEAPTKVINRVWSQLERKLEETQGRKRAS